MVEYTPRDFKGTMEAAVGENAARIAPVSRYANIMMGKLVPEIVQAQYLVGIPNMETIQALKSVDFKKQAITKDEHVTTLYDELGVKFTRGSRPLNVIEVCFEPKSPETMRDYFEQACRYRDEHASELKAPLKVFIGTTQTIERFQYMTKNGFLPDAVVSTNMAPLHDGDIRQFCKEHGIVLGPNVGFSSDNLVECIKSREFDADGNVIGGAAIQKVFPFGSINSIDFLTAMMSTHPDAILMPTGGVSNVSVRALLQNGVSLVGASAPAKMEAIVDAVYSENWEPFIRNASIMATEVYIGLLLRKEDKAKAKEKTTKYHKMFDEVIKKLGR